MSSCGLAASTLVPKVLLALLGFFALVLPLPNCGPKHHMRPPEDSWIFPWESFWHTGFWLLVEAARVGVVRPWKTAVPNAPTTSARATRAKAILLRFRNRLI